MIGMKTTYETYRQEYYDENGAEFQDPPPEGEGWQPFSASVDRNQFNEVEHEIVWWWRSVSPMTRLKESLEKEGMKLQTLEYQEDMKTLTIVSDSFEGVTSALERQDMVRDIVTEFEEFADFAIFTFTKQELSEIEEEEQSQTESMSLEDALPLIQKALQRYEGVTLQKDESTWGVTLVDKVFRGVCQQDRQQMTREYLERNLDKEARDRIGYYFTLAPEEVEYG